VCERNGVALASEGRDVRVFVVESKDVAYIRKHQSGVFVCKHEGRSGRIS
jgi:hypothetical protein